MKRNITKWFDRLSVKGLFALLLAAGSSGCITDPIERPGPKGGGDSGEQIQITVNIPGATIPSTRAVTGAQEAEVKTIDVLVFEANPTPGQPDVLAQRVAGESLAQSSNSTDEYKVTFVAKLTANPDATTIAVIANATDSVTAALARAPIGSEKQDVLEALLFSMPGKWNANPSDKSNPVAGTDYDPIPMYGEKNITSGGVKGGMRIEDIELIRMLARIDVVNNASNFTLTDVMLVTLYQRGYIAPAWDPANGTLLTSPPAQPTVPAIDLLALVIMGEQAYYDHWWKFYPYSHNNGEGMKGEIYAFESPATPNEDATFPHMSVTSLVFVGTISGDPETYYYRVDFTEPTDRNGKRPTESGFEPGNVDYMPLLRNHLYRVEIDKVNGKGYTHPEDAIAAYGEVSNLNTSLHVVDQSGIKSLVFNGRYFIGVETDDVQVPASGQEVSVNVTTNAHYGLHTHPHSGAPFANTNGIEYTLGGTDWIMEPGSLIQFRGFHTGGPGMEPLPFYVSPNPETTPREAYIHIYAAGESIEHKIKVTQAGKDPEPWGGGNDVLYFDETNTLRAAPFDNSTVTLANMAFFKQGGVIGFTNQYGTYPTIPWDNSEIRFNPSKYAIGTVDDGNTITQYSLGTNWSSTNNANRLPAIPAIDSVSVSAGHKNLSEPYYHNGANIRLGKGDPCRLVGFSTEDFAGKTAAQIEAMLESGDAGWRLPTNVENALFVGGPKVEQMLENFTLGSDTDFGDYNIEDLYYLHKDTSPWSDLEVNFYQHIDYSATDPSLNWYPVVQGTSPNTAGLSLPWALWRAHDGSGQYNNDESVYSSSSFTSEGVRCLYFIREEESPNPPSTVGTAIGAYFQLSNPAGIPVRCVRIADEPQDQKVAPTPLTLTFKRLFPGVSAQNGIPAAGENQAMSVTTNLQGWGVRVYEGNDNTGELLVDRPYFRTGTEPAIKVKNAPVESNLVLGFPENIVTTARNLSVYLYATELGSGKEDEIRVGTYPQAGIPAGVPAAPNVIGYFASGPNKGELTLDGDVSYGGTETVFTAYFKWGSLVATNSHNTGSFSAADIVAAKGFGGYSNDADALAEARAYVVTGPGQTQWDNVPYGDQDGPNSSGALVWPATNSSAGLGDACAHYFGSAWKTATNQDNNNFVGRPGISNNAQYHNGDVYYIWRHNNGINEGVFPLGTANGASIPAMGFRDAPDGQIIEQGTNGGLWSSTAPTGSDPYHLRFNSGHVYTSAADHNAAKGLAIRCVQVPFEPSLTTDAPAGLTFARDAEGAGYKQEFNVSTNILWDATVIGKGFTISPTSGGWKVGGNSVTTITVTPTANMTPDSERRTATIRFVGKAPYSHIVAEVKISQDGHLNGGGNHVLYFTDDARYPLALGRWETSLTDEDINDEKLDIQVINDRSKLAFFKFGSVIGFDLTGTMTSTMTAIKFNPSDLVIGTHITGYGSHSSTPPAIPGYVSDDYPKNVSNRVTYHTEANLRNGKGDPCMLAGIDMTRLGEADYLKNYDSGWRLPTVFENKIFMGLSLASIFSPIHDTPYYTASPASGWSSSNPGTGTFPLNKEGEEIPRLPAPGLRDVGGAVGYQGTNGYYWTSEDYSSGRNGSFLTIVEGLTNPMGGGYCAHGFNVRCVRSPR